MKTKEEKKAYNAEYRRRNAEDIREKKAEYRHKNAEQIREQQAEYNRKNAEQIREQKAEYRRKNAEQIRECEAEYRRKNLEKIRKVSEAAISELKDSYVALCVRVPVGHLRKYPEFIEAKRQQILTDRKLKKLNKTNQPTEP